ncbi:MAG: DegT/DnrJ/EryC1/StrS family aminotransferase [Nitrospiraceae bacterium]|nr:DegT/DnrJ/EryC1/StrS family aminotransferase [Nitrospiraceae bacterium]
MRISLVELKAQYGAIKEEIDSAIRQVIESACFSSGPFVETFERNFARAQDAPFCVCVNSGTSALHISLWALGIGPGDEVIVPANTFFATPQAVSLTGAVPVFADCEQNFHNIDPASLEEAVTPKTRAAIAVHLYGQPAKLDEVRRICRARNIHLIEDCAQAHLASYKGKKVGTCGVCGCFSFYPGKNLGAYGEGGSVITADEALYRRMLSLRDHGSLRKYHHERIGHNYRMDGIQGAVLDVKLRHLEDWTARRRECARIYRECLHDVGEVVLPAEDPDGYHVYHLFVVRAEDREGLKTRLHEKGIATGIHYPIPCHLQEAYRFLGYRKGSLPVSERLAGEILSLPMYAELERGQIEYICEEIRGYYGK